MKDSLKDLLQARFQGHEAPVDPATWQVIEARLLTSAPATDNVSELFKKRFADHETSVDPGVWQNISSQLGHGAAAGNFGSFGWIAAGVAGIAVVGGLIYALGGEPSKEPIAQAVVVIPEMVVEKQPTVVDPATEPIVSVQAVRSVQPTGTKESRSAEAVRPRPMQQDIPREEGGSPLASGSIANTDPTPLRNMDTSGAPIVREIQARIIEEAVRQQVINREIESATERPTLNPGSAGQSTDPDPIVEPLEPLRSDAGRCAFVLPDIFTPNNDGANDVFKIEAPSCITSARIRIFSLNGQLVHVMNNYEPWTGANCDEGWYLVAGEATTTDEDKVPVKGLVLLKRSGNN